MLNVKGIPAEIGCYLAGFTDGEGSFNVSFRPRQDYPLPWKVSLCFNISQRDPVILSQFKRHLECGTMRQRQDGVWYYEVNNLQPILENVIPFFRRFHFLSAKKKRDFAKFVELAELFKAGKHLCREGIEEILRIRRDMNDGGKRKYTDEDILGRFEHPQRLYARPLENERMIQSGLHGNMQSAAEMPAPDESKASDSTSNNHERS
jgi:hypothetical protein